MSLLNDKQGYGLWGNRNMTGQILNYLSFAQSKGDMLPGEEGSLADR